MTGPGGHAPPPARWERSGLAEAIGRLARYATAEFAVEDMLRQLCTAAAAALDVDAVGVMRLDAGRSRVVRTSHSRIDPLEQHQETAQDGPCRDAMDSGVPVAATTPGEIDVCWPAFSHTARAQRVQAVLALPLLSRGRCWGALDLYWLQPHTPTPDERAAAQLLADVAVSYIVMANDRADTAAAYATAAAAHDLLSQRVLYDDLTGLANRGLITEMIQHALVAAVRHHTSVALLFADVDRFKAINDTHGHHTGDLVLAEIARRLRDTVRDEDSVGRLAGDEFLILCEHLPAHPDDIATVTDLLVHRLHTAVAAPVTVGHLTLHPTLSIGVASSDGQHTVTDLIHRADTAMYRAKNSVRTPLPT